MFFDIDIDNLCNPLEKNPPKKETIPTVIKRKSNNQATLVLSSYTYLYG
jgi:hypothetical protein